MASIRSVFAFQDIEEEVSAVICFSGRYQCYTTNWAMFHLVLAAPDGIGDIKDGEGNPEGRG